MKSYLLMHKKTENLVEGTPLPKGRHSEASENRETINRVQQEGVRLQMVEAGIEKYAERIRQLEEENERLKSQMARSMRMMKEDIFKKIGIEQTQWDRAQNTISRKELEVIWRWVLDQ